MSLKKRVDDEDIVYDLDCKGLYTYDDEPFSGIGYYTTPTGEIDTEIEYENGDRKSERSWYDNRQLKKEILIFTDEDEVLTRRWHENGVLAEETLAEGGFISKRKRWDEAGILIEDFVIDESHPNFKWVAHKRRMSEIQETERKKS